AKAHQTLIDQADKFAENMLPIIKDISHYERSSVHKVADTLNTRGIQSRRGGLWTGSAVLNIIKRNGYAGLKMLANS
ncbi:MAG: recombinase family protein, partial [Rhodospirillaceae bacterium]